MDFPEHEKITAVKDESQAIGEFIESSGYRLCEWSEEADLCDCGDYIPGYVPVAGTIETILAKYFKIDLDKIEQEKRAMLEALRS